MIQNLTPAIIFWCALGLWGCQSAPDTPSNNGTATSPVQLTLLEPAQTGVDFANMVPYNDTFNCYTFRNFYNGGGAGMGDINNDGLQDLFFCGNMSPNRLYLNLGDFKFQDITTTCGMGLSSTWTAGVAFADVNGDGWLDIYTCKSGPLGGAKRHNELFINGGADASGKWSGQFTEQSQAWNLDNRGLSTHAAFFDYDQDGDLDCYLLNNSVRSVGGYDYRPGQRNTPDPEGGNKLLRNDGASFTDVTQKAGIYSSAIGFGLGVTIGDYDLDGWQDIFVSNDFFERDYLYHNNQNGTFKEVLESQMAEISKGSMGADMADLNNDGYPEIFVTEMTPPDDARYKTKAAFDDWNAFSLMMQTGYHRQFGRNVLQLNQQGQYFSEIGRMAGVHFTDWSWGALIADFDNDGLKDIFVANGIGKDLLDQDYTNFYADPAAVRSVLQNNPGQGIKTLIDKMPSQMIANCLFHQKSNDGYPVFDNIATAAGVGQPSFSNGSAYGDLDNDGDLDLIVNNVNAPCFIYRNEADKNGNNWLKIRVKDNTKNPFGLGAKVQIEAGGTVFYQEIAPMRGFESCVDPRPNIGLGKHPVAERVTITFTGGRRVVLSNVTANQILDIDASTASAADLAPVSTTPLLLAEKAPELTLAEAEYSDFDREPLLFSMYSTEGPKMATADVNADGLVDIFIGAPKGQAAQLWLQTTTGKYQAKPQAAFGRDAGCEDSAAAFFDADGDGDPDLYVGSGSNELEPGEIALQDRLYLNDGKGNFQRKNDALMTGKPFSTGCVAPCDVDMDGDTDVFVGMRMVPGHYGQNPTSFILKNNGQGVFEPAVRDYPELRETGMVTAATWADMDNDNDPDLVLCGDWEPVRIFTNQQGRLSAGSPVVDGLKNTNGWWNTLHVADLNQDGRMDIVLGNHGLNSRFKAREQEPLSLYISDFDNNGRDETILCQFNNGKSYPVALRTDMVRQLPMLKKKYLQFANYREQQIEQVFDAPLLTKALKKQAHTLSSAVLLNKGSLQFDWKPLPSAAQTSPIYAIATLDINRDGHLDLVLGGNHDRCKPETGIYMASKGTVLLGDGKGGFTTLATKQSGFMAEGCIRDLKVVNRRIVVVINNRPVQVFALNQ